MISIITAVHNQLEINKLFYANLVRYTQNSFELIIIDNNSKDGSREFFQSVGATVIENDGNYSYPHCQNQGIDQAKYDVFAFLNNDIIVSPSWDQKFIETMKYNNLDIVTCCGVERVQSKSASRKIRRRWRLIKTLLIKLPFARKYKLMHKVMYGNWLRFIESRYNTYQFKTIKGFVGNSVVMTRNAIEKVGKFDERMQGADFDLCMRSIKRSEEYGDIKPIHIALDVYIHHFIRITAKSCPPAFKDEEKLISFKEKWGVDTLPEGYQ